MLLCDSLACALFSGKITDYYEVTTIKRRKIAPRAHDSRMSERELRELAWLQDQVEAYERDRDAVLRYDLEKLEDV